MKAGAEIASGSAAVRSYILEEGTYRDNLKKKITCLITLHLCDCCEPSKVLQRHSRITISLNMHNELDEFREDCDMYINTFAASYLNTQGLNNSYLKSPASTLVDLTFQSRALPSFSLNQLRNLSL